MQFHGKRVTEAALIEAMGRGALVIYLSTPENEEVAGGAGIPFRDEGELALRLREVLAMDPDELRHFQVAAAERVRQRYSWESVTDSYERLFQRMLGIT